MPLHGIKAGNQSVEIAGGTVEIERGCDLVHQAIDVLAMAIDEAIGVGLQFRELVRRRGRAKQPAGKLLRCRSEVRLALPAADIVESRVEGALGGGSSDGATHDGSHD